MSRGSAVAQCAENGWRTMPAIAMHTNEGYGLKKTAENEHIFISHGQDNVAKQTSFDSAAVLLTFSCIKNPCGLPSAYLVRNIMERNNIICRA